MGVQVGGEDVDKLLGFGVKDRKAGKGPGPTEDEVTLSLFEARGPPRTGMSSVHRECWNFGSHSRHQNSMSGARRQMCPGVPALRCQ